MGFEVEVKFHVDDFAKVQDRLKELGAAFHKQKQQIDLYLKHPSRDFASTDEALRLRCDDGRYCVTYKGPKVDAETKTREEIELPLAAGEDTPQQWTRLLEKLGFGRVAEVHKTRSVYGLQVCGFDVEVALDSVQNVGSFVELETQADEARLDEARTMIRNLADRLGVTASERRSYLEMLLESRK